MATTSRQPRAPLAGPLRPRQPLHRRAVRGRHPPRRGPRRRRRPARRPDRQAHRPLARGQVHRRRAVEPRRRSGGARSTGRSREAHYDRLRARLVEYARDARPVRPGLLHRRRAGPPPLAARLHRDRLGEHLRAQPVPPADRRQLAAFAPNFTIICVPSFKADPETEGTRTGTAILVHLGRMEILIVGTEYAGEIKKSAFTVMNYLMPDEGVLPMHSAINVGAGRRRGGLLRPVGDRQDDAVGRSARGASSATTSTAGATASRSTSRAAATPRRSASRRCTSPTSSRPRAASGRSSRTSTSIRGRASSTSTRSGSPRTPAAPTRSTSSATPTRPGIAGTPRAVVFLTADAFGVLPPISRLTREQAAYHFISGYTAKLAGTEVGVKEPKATFSACFGAPFMPRHPGEYARDAGRAARARRRPGLAGQHRLDGRAVRDRRADEHRPHPVDGPGGARRRARRRPDAGRPELRRRGADRRCPDVPDSFLDPRATWADPDAYDRGGGQAGRHVPRQLRGLRRRRRRRRSRRPVPGRAAT